MRTIVYGTAPLGILLSPLVIAGLERSHFRKALLGLGLRAIVIGIGVATGKVIFSQDGRIGISSILEEAVLTCGGHDASIHLATEGHRQRRGVGVVPTGTERKWILIEEIPVTSWLKSAKALYVLRRPDS